MCGIVGYAGSRHGATLGFLEAMRDEISHRGPDAAGQWHSSDLCVWLGHRRLSILDLTPFGAQPMASEDEHFAIVFNGEIYNHKQLRSELLDLGATFKGRSDTEVLLAAYQIWGTKCLSRLRGMFAFAIYDSSNRTLFLARDRAGEKPLFWARHREGLVFVSELKALMADKDFQPKLSPQGLDYYLAFGYVPGHHCILDGVHKLPPAHFMLYSLESGNVEVKRYWDIPTPNATADNDRITLVDELQKLLTDSVQEQLVADVPVAVLLSGGVDSSIITAIAASVSGKPVRTFTVGVPGNKKFDESRFGRRIAEHFGTEHVELPIDTSSINLIPTLARQYDEPMCDSSMIPTYLLAKTVSQHCKVVLGGDGGDELFGGYRMYQGALQQDRVRRLLPSPLRSAIAWGAQRYLPPGMNKRNGLIGLRGSLEDGIAQVGVIFDDHFINKLSPWLAQHGPLDPPLAWHRKLAEPERGVPGAAMAADFRSYLPEDILVKVDRASMLCSLEVRAPLLDYRIIEFAYTRVPNALRATSTDRKILLKQVARRLLPADHDLERKQGFSIPVAHWMTEEAISAWREECADQISAIFSTSTIDHIITNPNKGKYPRLFSLMMITWWMRHYNIAV